MRKLGNLDLVGNYLKNVTLTPVTEWPAQPKVGAFVNYRNRIYLCTELEGTDGLPIYVPVTSTVSTYLHNQVLASDTWVIQHGLNYGQPVVFVYDLDNNTVMPDEIEVVDANTVIAKFSMAVAGRAIVMCATDNLVNGGASDSSGGVSGSGHTHTNLSLLEQLQVVDNVLKFGDQNLQYQLSNGDVVAGLSVVDGVLAYNGQQVGKQLSNADVLAKFSVVNGILFYDGAQVDNVGDTFTNAAILAQLSVVNGELFYNGVKIDHVGDTYQNSDVLQKLSVVSGVLYYDGIKVDTVGHTFDNQTVLDNFSVDGNGNLLFNGLALAGTALANQSVVEQLTDVAGALYYKGNVIGSQGTVNLSINNMGTGHAVVSSIIGTQLNAKTLVAGSNVTLNSTSDTITINSTLGGTVTASTTFKTADAYVNTNVLATSSATQILATEASTSDTGLLFLARLGSDAKSNTKDVALPTTGSVTPNSTLASAPSGVATLFNNGRLTVANGTTYTDTSPATWFAGTVDWTIECDIVRDTSKLAVAPQNIVSGWNAYVSQSSVWIGLEANNKVYASVSNGTSAIGVVGTTTIADSNKHHIEVNRSGGTLRLFIDGALAGSVAFTGSIPAGTGFWIGNSGDSAIPYYGYIRDLKVYNYAKHTAAYTVAGYYVDKVGTINTVDMAGKLLSSAFWKTVTSLAVTSTETATAYLKWMLRTADGTVYKWDTATSTFIADSSANILTSGVNTAQMVAALASYGWNYKSDNIGFVVAFVTTDGASTPVLTSLTLTAVQSADKTAGHTIVNSQGNALNQRTNLKFVGVGVSDDPTNNQTVVTGVTDTSGLTHSGQNLQTLVNGLQSGNGTINGKVVDLTNVTQGSVPTFDQSSGTFKMGIAATGSQGNGLYRTAPFALAAGAEITVTHQTVTDGRAVYQADQVIASAAANSVNRMFNASDKTLVTAIDDSPYLSRDVVKLPTTYLTSAVTSATNFPITYIGGVSYTVDDYIYVMPSVGGNWSTISALYRAHVSAPTSYTLVNTFTPVAWPINAQVFRYGNTLFQYSGGSFMTADVSKPDTWTIVAAGTGNAALNLAAAFLVGSVFYVMGGYSSGYVNTIYSVDLSKGFNSAWTKSANTLPTVLGRCSGYQYGDYLYIIGGELTLDSAYSNKVLRASINDPTTWTQIGTYPISVSTSGITVQHGKIYVVGGRYAGAPVANVYMADASNPTAWTALASLPVAKSWPTIVNTIDGFYAMCGLGDSIASPYNTSYKYTITPTVSIGSGTVVMSQLNTSLMQQLNSILVIASIPASTTIQTAINFDGVWKYWSGTAWTTAASMSAALSQGANLVTTATANEFTIAGTAALPLANQYIQVAFLMSTSVTTATPELYSLTYNYQGKDTYSPMLITSYANGFGEIGLKHVQGTYNTTNILNKTASALTLTLKVYDGYGTGA